MSPPQDERIEKFDLHLKRLLRAINLLYDNDLIIPSMMLLYATTDGMAWLYRNHENENSGAGFQDWVNQFWITELGGLNSVDLWAARNALLHEQSSNSRDTRKGKARSIWYLFRGATAEIPLGGQWQEPPYFVRSEDMIAAFRKATDRFRAFILASDPVRRDQILSRCGEWFDRVVPTGRLSVSGGEAQV